MERCSLEKQGFVGVYYPGTYRTDMAIIASGGASCDEKLSTAMCRFLRDAGYNVLVLGFYMWEGLSDTLVSIPVDYAERAVHWLKDEKKIKGIAMTAASTGAGYTLLSASLIPEIGCVIPVVPYDYVMEGTTNSFKRLGRSVYMWHGQDVPYSPWTLIDEGLPRIFLSAIKDKKYGLRRFMRYGYDHNSVTEESRIKVENMHADVLLLGVRNDDGWPSDEAVSRMVKVLETSGYPYRVEHYIYDKASHALTDGLDDMSGYAKWAFKNMLPAEKSIPKNAKRQEKTVLKESLSSLMNGTHEY